MKSSFEKIIQDVVAELAAARKKFPAPNKNLIALNEEVGEVNKGVLEIEDEFGQEKLYKEVIQTMAMCVRLIEEGDPQLEVPELLNTEPVLRVKAGFMKSEEKK